jgi:hypothetical protein
LLVQSGRAHLRRVLAAGSGGVLSPALALFRMVDGNRELYRVMRSGRGSERIMRTGLDMVGETLAEEFAARLPSTVDPVDAAVAARFLAGGATGLLAWWLDGSAALSADELFTRFERVARPVVVPLCRS